ncbi:MAG: hypothetical protein EBV03_03075 [Proteobacteria bacterium]|nr:hypothetical protein [Pseudomonadota bacterium]
MEQAKPKFSIRKWLRDYALLVFFAAAQVGFWAETHHIEPDMGIVPEVPSRKTLHALTFGDDQFYFRIMAFTLQNAGDTFGRFTALRYYDFNKLYHWFTLLDELDARSNMIASMATYYYAQTQNTPDVRYIVDYLYEHATRDVEHKWWWLLQSIYLAMHKLNDTDLALKVAQPLQNEHVPVWARQMTAVVYEKRGEMDDALRIMETIRDNAKEIPESDLNFMTYFVKERLKKLEKSKEFGVWPPVRPAPATEAMPAPKGVN